MCYSILTLQLTPLALLTIFIALVLIVLLILILLPVTLGGHLHDCRVVQRQYPDGLLHAFGSTFIALIGCSCMPVCKTYFISNIVLSPESVYQSGARCTLLNYSVSTTMAMAEIIPDMSPVSSWRLYGLLSHLKR